MTPNPPAHMIRTVPSTSKPPAASGSYFPCPIDGLNPPPRHRLPLGASVSKLSCLFVCFALSLCWRPCLRLSSQPAHKMFSPVSLCCVSHTQTHRKMLLFLPSHPPPLPHTPSALISCSDDTGRLIYWLLVNMINSSSVCGPALTSA